MKEHEHAAKTKPETKPGKTRWLRQPTHLSEGRPAARACRANWLEAEAQLRHGGSAHPDHHDHPDHHAHMAADFRKRFWISLALTLPILLLSPLLQKLVACAKPFGFR